jgi:glycosyltransferase involved in cell wall biosynthesis
MEHLRFSVIVPTYNRKNTLRRCLTAATGQDYPDYEVIVVDDGSTDGTGEMVRREFPQARCFRQEENRGPAAARNCGIREASGEVVAFTDDDCLVPADWLRRLADGYHRYPKVIGVGGYLEAPNYLLSNNILAQYERSVGRNHYGAADTEVLGEFECPAGGTNNMSYRRAALLNIGGFDETFPFAAGEDADLKWRLCQRGARLLYVPVKVTHLQPYTWKAFRRQQIIRGHGAAAFEHKHLGHTPTTSRVLLRLAKRTLLLLYELLVKPNRYLTLVRFAARWYEGLGQLKAARKRDLNAIRPTHRPDR